MGTGIRERGIGNTAFALVLVVLIIAIAAFVVQKNDNDGLVKEARKWRDSANAAALKQASAERAYDMVVEVVGETSIERTALEKGLEDADAIRTKLRTWLHAMATELETAGQFTMRVEGFQVNAPAGIVVKTEGSNTTVRLYNNPDAAETIKASTFLRTLKDSLAHCGKYIRETGERADASEKKNAEEVSKLKAAIADAQTKFAAAISQVQSNSENIDTQRRRAEDDRQALTGEVDKLRSEVAQVKADSTKTERKLIQDLRAQKDALINEKERKKVALAEDPEDGEVVEVGETLGTLWVNLGRRHKLSSGTKFKVWRRGKGNVREYVAVVKVIKVNESISECRVLERLDSRIPVTKGMYVSNPFYDPRAPLRVHIYGDLQRYTSDVAYARLRAAGCEVVRTLDDTVQIIVLGEPGVATEEVTDETEAAAAERRAAVERDRRLNAVMEKAASIGAVVVTEGVLSSFIDY